MSRSEESGSPSWSASSFMQTTEDVARAVAAAAAAATAARSTRPSVVYSSKEDSNGSQLRKLQHQVSKVLKGFSHPREVKNRNYNPEILTSQKRQWAHFQLQSLDHRSFKEPSRLFESMVVVGIHPNCDTRAFQKQFLARKSEGSGKLRGAVSSLHQSRVGPNLEPQVLFAYPPEKRLPLKYKDLLSFCFPGGVEVHAVDRTPSMSEINEILLGQEHLKQSDLSFVFRLQVADDSTLYGCCVLVEELVQKPSGLISMISDKQPSHPSLSRRILTTRRCYCILSRLPLFELHFGILNSIFTEERLERLTKGIGVLDLESPNGCHQEEGSEDKSNHLSPTELDAEDSPNGIVNVSPLNLRNSRLTNNGSLSGHLMREGDIDMLNKQVGDNAVVPIDPEAEMLTPRGESATSDAYVHNFQTNRQIAESFQGSPSEDRNSRSDIDETETDEASFSGQEYPTDHTDILEWAKANNCGSLQIICEYYRLPCPSRGSTLTFHPLEHLHPLELHRPDEMVLHIAGSRIALESCSTSLELAEAHTALLAEEEATALSVWAVACLCGSLRLENVLAMFAGALLEKHIVVVCSNLGTLSALVLSIIPLIRPSQWQSLLMPVLPDDMLDFLDAPVPYIVGVKHKTTEVQSKLTNVILVDANKNQVKSPTLPQLPQQKELISSLSPYHAKLVGESYLARKRPVYECTDVQIEAARGFLAVLRSYLDSLCSSLRSHTITNVQSNDDKVSLLLKESFIESFPSRDRPFMKLFVETQLFSVHTDLVLSFFQKE